MTISKQHDPTAAGQAPPSAPERRSDAAIVCRGVTKNYGSGNALVQALRGVDLDVFPGELTLIAGPSGCGKTTLLSVVAGILNPTGGEVHVLGAAMHRLSRSATVRFRRRHIGFIFQQFNLLPSLTAAENVTIPLILAGWSRAKALKRAEALLEQMDMGARATRCRPNSRAANSSGWRSPGASCISPTCWCATSRLRRWMRRPGTRSWNCFAAWRSKAAGP